MNHLHAKKTLLMRGRLALNLALSGNPSGPESEPPAPSSFDTHRFQVGGDEILHLAQVFQIAALVAGYVRDMTMPHTPAPILRALLDPDFHNERLCIRLY